MSGPSTVDATERRSIKRVVLMHEPISSPFASAGERHAASADEHEAEEGTGTNAI